MLHKSNKLETVKRFLQLELSREKELQDIVTLTAEICQTPIALITFMDDETQWIKFRLGTDVTQNSREASFCKHLIDKEDLMVVPDTLQDDRFINHPLVESALQIRFYAGAPLTTHDGHHLGTLCVFDQKPHQLTPHQQNMLRILSKQVTHLLELELSIELLREHVIEINAQKQKIESSENILRSFLDSSAAAYILLDIDMKVIEFNKAAIGFLKKIFHKNVTSGMLATEHIGASFAPLFKAVFPEILTGKTKSVEYLVNYGDEGHIWWEIAFNPAYTKDDLIIGVSIVAKNINERKLHTERITAQNKALARIAHIQSHGLRKPVASILGLMNVMKADDYTDPRESLLQMEKAALELDDTIHAIIRQAELIPPNLTSFNGPFNAIA